MDALSDLLQKSHPNEPPQLRALRDYVKKHHNQPAKSGISTLGYTLTVNDGMIATTLRMELPQIQKECSLDKKLFIRIGVVN